jgi:creatinine amidohydrolase
MARAEAGRPEPILDLVDELRANGVRAVSPNGVLGDPRRANANHGKALITRLIIDLVAAVDEWRS